jgi:hypothetical protein
MEENHGVTESKEDQEPSVGKLHQFWPLQRKQGTYQQRKAHDFTNGILTHDRNGPGS